jgi:hypothetical protein
VKSHIDDDFRKAFQDLPGHVKQQARQAYRLFVQNPRHPSLHFKCIDKEAQVYSARIGLHHRALGVLVGEDITWFWIGSHADYDRLIANL